MSFLLHSQETPPCDIEKLVAKPLSMVGQDLGRHSSREIEQVASEMCRSSSASSAANVPQASTFAGSVPELREQLNRTKLAEVKLLKPAHVPSDNVCLVGETSGRIKWIQPSGPRPAGQGIEDEEQGIVAAEPTASGGAMLRITLLASGFIIGTSGSSVREICKQTGADIKSWTDNGKQEGIPRHTRTFVIEGRRRAVVLAVNIICDAVDRYKDLCEGAFCGQNVSRSQIVRGIKFSYQPPPRNVVPYAAALTGQGNRSKSNERAAEHTHEHFSEGHILQDVNSTLNIQQRSVKGMYDKAPLMPRHAGPGHLAFANENLVGQAGLPLGRGSHLHHGQLPPGYILVQPKIMMNPPEGLRQAGYAVNKPTYPISTGLDATELEAYQAQQQAIPGLAPPLPSYGNHINPDGTCQAQGRMYHMGLQQMMLNEILATGHYHAGRPDAFQQTPAQSFHQSLIPDYTSGNNVGPLSFPSVPQPASGTPARFQSPARSAHFTLPANASRGRDSPGPTMSAPWVQGNHPFLMGPNGSTGHQHL